MNIEPKTPLTTVKLLRAIPFDSSYKDQMDFANVGAQFQFFNSKVKYTFDNMTPVAMQNAIRIPKPADDLYDCNYIMFQNANFNSKWFYAFIKKIEFVNVNCCYVHFDLDVWQTWQFDITIRPSFVEREMINRDNFGDNLVVENIDFGPYVDEPAETTDNFDSYTAVVATAYSAQDPDYHGGYVGGLFTGLYYLGARVDNDSDVQMLLDYLTAAIEANKVDAITSIFMMPTDFYTMDSKPKSYRFDATKHDGSVGGYVPRCKKVLTYPYNMLYVYTTDGNSAIYRYEWFQGVRCGFIMQCAMSCNPEIILEPIAYNNQQFNVNESLTMTGFPQCSWSIDAYKAWLAQTASTTALNMVGNAINVVGGVASASTGQAIGGVMGLASNVNSIVLAQARPPQAKGQQGNDTWTGTREKNFYFVNKHVTAEYAKMIDDYFWAYGYAVDMIKQPNITGRPYWNYVKTRDVKIVGSIPFDDMAKLRSLFDSGITFWHTPSVGDYNLNNRPTA